MELSNDLKIYQLLQTKLNDNYLIKDIIKHKKELEKKEAMQYHIKQWLICGHKYMTETSTWLPPTNAEDDYIVHKDKHMEFYESTRIPQQCVYLLHQLLVTTDLYERKKLDELYDILSREIWLVMDE